MASSTWATRGGAPRYPVQLTVMTDEAQESAVREFAEAINSSISEIGRDAIAAGLPILRRRAQRDGLLPEAVA